MNLIIFFNGWGMDSNIFSKIQNKEGDNYQIIYINYPYKIPEIDMEKYKNIYIVAWSFGVYYGNRFLKENPKFQKYKSIALNGTPEMIGRYGILKKMIRFTLDTLTKESLEKFYINMGGISYFEAPQKEIEELKKELNFFIENYKTEDNYFKFAIVSEKDRIVPYKNQESYFKEHNVIYKKVQGEHFLFSKDTNLVSIVKGFEYEI